MAICIELPEEVQKYNAKIISISIGDQREGELLLALEQDRDCPKDMVKLFQTLTGEQGVTIDGRKVKAEVLNRTDDNKTLLYLDWTKEGNQSVLAPELDIECWDAVADGLHNSNSHLVYWKDEFWLIHANSPYHFATPECKLILWRSKDAKNWTQVTTFSIPDEDIRDPKFAVIKGKLFIYVLKSFVADSSEPYTTAYTYTEDGEHFAPLTDLLKNHGWLFWNPKTIDNETWYVPAYWGGHGNSIMLKTTDGENFTPVCYIHQGKKGLVNDRNDETDFDFLGDGTMISTQRLEFSEDPNGDSRACTNIAICKAPYEGWIELGKDYSTRLDGPSLFSYNGNVYAVGRRNPYDYTKAPNYIGCVYSRKRTSIYQVTEKGMIFLSDFPSAGDTSYGGCVLHDGYLYASYYSSRIDADWPWYVGMLSPSNIKMVKISLDKLETYAQKVREEYERDNKYKFVPVENL
jgi:hypothetical protein